MNDGTPETTYYVYDAAGQRVRKVTERQNGDARRTSASISAASRSIASTTATARRHAGARDAARDGRQAAHRAGRETVASGAAVSSPTPAQRYQFGNHLGSASLELDENGRLISYEEYCPYGSTSYQAGQRRRGEPEALSLYGQGAGRGERVHLSRRAVLRAVAGTVDELRSDPALKRMSIFMRSC